jgi:hypothetical protein
MIDPCRCRSLDERRESFMMRLVLVLAGMALLALSASAQEPRGEVKWNNPDGPEMPGTEAHNAKAVVTIC